MTAPYADPDDVGASPDALEPWEAPHVVSWAVQKTDKPGGTDDADGGPS